MVACQAHNLETRYRVRIPPPQQRSHLQIFGLMHTQINVPRQSTLSFSGFLMVLQFNGQNNSLLKSKWRFDSPWDYHKTWPPRLSVRTRDFHSLKRSSILLGATIENNGIRWVASILNGEQVGLCRGTIAQTEDLPQMTETDQIKGLWNVIIDKVKSPPYVSYPNRVQQQERNDQAGS